MWLLHTTTLELRAFVSDIPRYAILSHVWEATDHPHMFQEMLAIYAQCRVSGGDPRALVNDKVRNFCAFAEGRGFEWVWLDTCCIDKSSSAELSEAINSMYVWYKNAATCFAFLCDVGDEDDPISPDSEFRRSRWHTRGWTLQELLIPHDVTFVSRHWNVLGTKASLGECLEKITGISWVILVGRSEISSVCVAQRFSWMSRRETTRAEDRAYSLLGIVGVTMPIVYGEGLAHAFFRLQKKITKTTPDHSILAGGDICPDFDAAVTALLWPDQQVNPVIPLHSEALTTTPSDFAFCGDVKDVTSIRPLVSEGCIWTSEGLVSDFLLSDDYMPCPDSHDYGIYAALLPYCKEDAHIVVFLRMRPEDVSRSPAVVPLATLGCSIKLQDTEHSRFYRGALLKDWSPDRGCRHDFTITKVCVQSGARRRKAEESTVTPGSILDIHLKFSEFIRFQCFSTVPTAKPKSFHVPYWCLRRMEVVSGFLLDGRTAAMNGDGHRIDSSAIDYADLDPTPLEMKFTNAVARTVLTIRFGPGCRCLSPTREHSPWWLEVHLREPQAESSEKADAHLRNRAAPNVSKDGRLLRPSYGAGHPPCACMGKTAAFRGRMYLDEPRKHEYVKFTDGARSLIVNSKFHKTDTPMSSSRKDDVHVVMALVSDGFKKGSISVDSPVAHDGEHVDTEPQHSEATHPVSPSHEEPIDSLPAGGESPLALDFQPVRVVHDNLSAIRYLLTWFTASPDYSYGSLV